MPRTKKPELRFPIKLTWGQRKMLPTLILGLPAASSCMSRTNESLISPWPS